MTKFKLVFKILFFIILVLATGGAALFILKKFFRKEIAGTVEQSAEISQEQKNEINESRSDINSLRNLPRS